MLSATQLEPLGMLVYRTPAANTQHRDYDLILPPSVESACRRKNKKNKSPEALQQAAQGLKGNSIKYRYGGDRCLQCVASWH